MRLVLALTMAVMLTTSAAHAATFYVTNRTADAWTVVDLRAVEMLADGVRRVPSVTIQRSIANRGAAPPGYLRSIGEYDCARRQARWITFTLYSSTGASLVTERNAKSDWAEPGRGTDTGSTLSLLCGEPGGVDLPTISANSIGDIVVRLISAWSTAPAPAAAPAPIVKAKPGSPIRRTTAP